MKISALRLLALAALLPVPGAILHAADGARISPEQLQSYLRQYPDADTNQDGILSLEEARAYLQKMRGGKAKTGAPAAAPALPPTYSNVHYGPHERNVLDFWQAKSDRPTPVVVFMHGGGVVSGDKAKAGGAAFTMARAAGPSAATSTTSPSVSNFFW